MKGKKVKNKAAFDTKAVDYEDGLAGIVRMSGSEGAGAMSVHVKGICAFYIYSPSDEQVLLQERDLFFYGNIKALKKNYTRRIPSFLRFRRYYDKSLSQSSLDYSPRISDGYFSIPFEHLKLERRRPELVSWLVGELKKKLPVIVQNLESVEVDPEGKYSMVGFGNAFADLPIGLREVAEEQRRYYRLRKGPKEKEILPKVVPITIEKLPTWIRRYVHRV